MRREERREPRQPRRTPVRKILGREGERWGNLPPRTRRDVLDQQSEAVPERFRAAVEKYYKQLAGAEDE